MCIMCHVAEVSNTESANGSIAQLGEHLPYKQEVTGSRPVVPTTKSGPVVQSVSTPACHAGGRRFESVRGRQTNVESFGSPQYASVAQSVEQWTENPRVVGSIPTGGTICLCPLFVVRIRFPIGSQDAGVAHPVERHLAKVEEASSSLVTRSNKIE